MIIYTTQEQVDKWKSEKAVLEKFYMDARKLSVTLALVEARAEHLGELIADAIVLPVEESWGALGDKFGDKYMDDEADGFNECRNGVIIIKQ